MTRLRVYWWIALALTGAAFAASALVYPFLPDTIPTHWNIRGEVDGWGSKTWAVFLVPAMMAGMLAVFAALPWLSPRNFEIDSFRETYLYLVDVITGLLAYVHAVTLYAAARVLWGNGGVDTGRLLVGGMFLFFGLMGNVMGKVRRNFYVGIRVPWTLASDRVWNDTHRVAAWTMVGGSAVGLCIIVAGLSLVAALVVLMGSLLIPVVYSLIHYKRLERRGAL